MEKVYRNQLTLSQSHKGVPYGGTGAIREDGDANYGFKDIKGNPKLIHEIPELKRDPHLMQLIQVINAPETALFSLGCLSGCIEDERGVRFSGYVEISWNSKSAIADAATYFPLFFHFDRMLHELQFDSAVVFEWELQPVTFLDANSSGFSCSVFINTHYSATKKEAHPIWAAALRALEFFLGSIPKEHDDLIFGQSLQPPHCNS